MSDCLYLVVAVCIAGFAGVGNAGAMENLSLHLKHGEDCVEAVQKMSLRKFNNEQCGYLSDKLQVVVKSAKSYLTYLQAASNAGQSVPDVAKQVDIFKLQHALATQIVSFLQGCCNDSWIQAAMTMTNVWEYVASVGFNLELCRVAFSIQGQASTGGLTRDEVEDIYRAEVEIVKQKASADVDILFQKVIWEMPSLSSENKDLACYLMQRLKQMRPTPASGSSSGSGNGDNGGFLGRLFKCVKRGGRLGSGASGTVDKAMWLGTPVAKKTFHVTSSADFIAEVEILSPLCHPNVMSLFCWAKNERSCSIIMELMDEDLFALMQERLEENDSPPFPILEAVDIMLQIGEGVKYLHDKNIVHMDLKSKNIFVKIVRGDDFEDGYVYAKVGDFGLSKTKENSTGYSCMTYNVGTSRWMPPEIIKLVQGDEGACSSTSMKVPKYPFKRDTYSFGMVCFEILTGDIPFVDYNDKVAKEKVVQGERPKLPEDCPLMLKDLIERCWSKDPRERPTFVEVCSNLRCIKYLLIRGDAAQDNGISSNKFSTSYYNSQNGPSVVVGLDIGTTFSGFAYAHTSDAEQVCVHYEWPGFEEASGKLSCKTKTALYYKRSRNGLELDSWGWQAQLNYSRDLNLVQRNRAAAGSVGELVTRFKLHLAKRKSGPLSATPLPRGLTAKQVITDFLREIGKFIMEHLKLKYGDQLTLDVLQWCVTVPSIWGDKAKQQMKSFMEGAGLVGGSNGSPHPVVIVLEPEAAAVHCLKQLNGFKLNQGDKLLVADIGRGTSDIMVLEKVNSSGNLKLREASSGGPYGGSNVDESFLKFMSAKIGCLDDFLVEYPGEKIRLQKWWDHNKSILSSIKTDDVFACPLSAKLGTAWENHDKSQSHDGDYTDVEITHADMVEIFSGVVNDNSALIRAHLAQTFNIKIIMVVGGFATSKYLMSKIMQAFEPGCTVVSPINPESSVCQGAVSFGFFPDNFVS